MPVVVILALNGSSIWCYGGPLLQGSKKTGGTAEMIQFARTERKDVPEE